jgi:predicted transcriptional regulator
MAISVNLDNDLRNRIQHLSELQHRSAHWIMCKAIRDYVEREEKRESLKQDALCAWEEYQENGLHLILEEADAWLAKLEAGEDAEVPKCHI